MRQAGRSAQGRRMQTRPVGSIDRGVQLNRALWVLAEEMRRDERVWMMGQDVDRPFSDINPIEAWF